MIIVLDSRHPLSLGVDVNLRLEAFLENSKQLLSKCCVLGPLHLVDAPTGLIVPTSGSQGKMVQVVCRGRPVMTADVSCSRLVDVHENGYGDGFGWKFLVDAALTATRIRSHPLEEVVILTTDLMLAGEDLENEARFFSETSEAVGATTGPKRSAPTASRISLVFVEVVGRSPCRMSSAAAAAASAFASDSLTAWSELQRLRNAYSGGGAFLLDLVDNTTAMFDSQLRCWMRDSSPRQVCSLRLPATETFSGVVVEIEITPYLLNQGRLKSKASQAALLHNGFSNMQVIQGLRLDTLDQGLCRGDPLLCIPSHFRSSTQRSQANRKLFMAVCAELNERDTGLLLSLEHPSTCLQERWLLIPQAPPTDLATARARSTPAAGGGLDDGSTDGAGAAALVDRALLIRLATKEDVLEDGPDARSISGIFGRASSELSVERAAASASLEVLKTGTYNPLQHSSGLLHWLASQQQQQQQGRLNSCSSNVATTSATALPRSARAVGGHGSRPVAPTTGVNRKHLHHVVESPQQHLKQQQQQQQQRKQRKQQRFSLMPTASLSASSSKASGTSRRATMGGEGGGGGRGARGKSRSRQQQQQPAKAREVSLRYAEAPPQQQQQQQQQQQRGGGRSRESRTKAAGDAREGGTVDRVSGGAKGKSANLTASDGGHDKRGGTRADGKGKAKSGDRQKERIARRHSVGGGGGGGVEKGGGSSGSRDDDEGMML